MGSWGLREPGETQGPWGPSGDTELWGPGWPWGERTWGAGDRGDQRDVELWAAPRGTVLGWEWEDLFVAVPKGPHPRALLSLGYHCAIGATSPRVPPSSGCHCPLHVPILWVPVWLKSGTLPSPSLPEYPQPPGAAVSFVVPAPPVFPSPGCPIQRGPSALGKGGGDTPP